MNCLFLSLRGEREVSHRDFRLSNDEVGESQNLIIKTQKNTITIISNYGEVLCHILI